MLYIYSTNSSRILVPFIELSILKSLKIHLDLIHVNVFDIACKCVCIKLRDVQLHIPNVALGYSAY